MAGVQRDVEDLRKELKDKYALNRERLSRQYPLGFALFWAGHVVLGGRALPAVGG